VHDGTEDFGLSKKVSWQGGNPFFQFNEEVVRLQTMYLKLTKNTLMEDVEHRSQPIILHEYLTGFFPLAILGLDSALVTDFSILQRTGMPFASQFTTLQELLPFRATSVASDEPLCIANLFNWDVMQILRSPEETRTENLWSLLSEYPPEVIFSIGKKLGKSASRWAPASFLRQRASVYHRFSATTPAHLTSKGLTVKYPGWLLDCQKGVDVKEIFHMIEDSDFAYLISCIDNSSGQTPQVSDQSVGLRDRANSSSPRLALISRSDLQGTGIDRPAVSLSSILVLVYRHEGQVFFTRYICPARIRRLNIEEPRVQMILDALKEAAPARSRKEWSSMSEQPVAPWITIVIRGLRSDSQQLWCID
jgi:hypothetical protein